MRNRRWNVLVAVLVAGIASTFVAGGCPRGSAVYMKSVPITRGFLRNSGWAGLVDQPATHAPPSRRAALLGTDRVVLVPESDVSKLIICARDTGNTLASSTWGREWYINKMARSQNGNFVLICLSEETTVTGNSRFNKSCRIGIIGIKDGLRWLTPIRFSEYGFGPTGMAVSGDGKLFGLSAIGGAPEVGLWSVKEEKALWRHKPQGESQIYDVAFSGDDKTLYAAGTSGWVRGYEVTSGKIVKKWLASKSARSVYGYRATKVAASPDGALVAAGTGPNGDVYVWDVKTGERVALIATKGSTICYLAFSPDSSMLAICGVQSKAIEIWRVR